MGPVRTGEVIDRNGEALGSGIGYKVWFLSVEPSLFWGGMRGWDGQGFKFIYFC